MENELFEKIKKTLLDTEFGYSVSSLDITECKEGFVPVGNGKIDSLPPLTRIQIVCKPGPMSNVRVEIWLPDADKWNGRFLGLGNGGLAGFLRYDMLGPYVRCGFAVANTDMGTSDGKLSGYNNIDVVKDFGWRSTHVMTVFGKAAAYSYYNKDSIYSYFFGQSTGGQQAFSEATRFPYDYNGIFAGVPAFDRTGVHTYFILNYCNLHDKDGNSIFTEENIHDINKAATEFFKKIGYVPEGEEYIVNPIPYENVADDFVGFLSKKFDWMDETKALALKNIYTGPRNTLTGKRIYCGMPIGAELNEGGMLTFNHPACPNDYPFFWAYGPDFEILKFKFADDYEKYQELLSGELNATVSDFSGFIKAGGKLLSISGSEDPWVPFMESYRLYDMCCEKYGKETVKDFMKIYMLPGRAHHAGRGAPNLFKDRTFTCDEIGMLVNWVEKGEEPGKAIAAGRQTDGKFTLIHDILPYGE